jgi:hypothetical protein
MIIRKRKVSEDSTLSTQEKISKSKRKKERCQAEDEMVTKDSKNHALLHYGLHAVDEEISSFDQSYVEPATDYQSQAECGSSTSDSEDQMREEPFRDSPTVQTMDKSSNKDSWSERRGEDDVREEESLFTARKSFTSESEKGQSVGVPPRQKKSKPKAKKRKVNEDSTLSKQEMILKNKRKKERCQGEDEMVTKDTKQNKKKKWKKERKASYHHLVVPAGTNLINANGNVNDNGNAHEEVVDEHTVAATEIVEEQSITDIDENVTSMAGMPALDSPPPVNSKRKHNQEYESKHDEKWNRFFMELVEYKETNGDCNIPTRNGSLGGWIDRQRTSFISKKLKADRYEKLMGIGFVFENAKVATDNEKWNNCFMELVKYKEMNGHCNVPTRNVSFGKWIYTQRVLFRSEKLKTDRHEKLVGIGFTFEDARFAMEDEKWNRCFMKLVEYKEKNGHCNIPTKKNGSLGRWIKYQRELFRSEKLMADRYEKLVGIGFIFEDVKWGKFDQQWQDMYQKLLKYMEMKGHCNIPTTNGSLGGWIHTQRASFRSKKLKADRHEKLVEIGFAFWDVTALEFKGKLDQQWQDMYQKLLKHKETKGHCFDLPQTLPLGGWLSWQRRLYKHGNLREDRAEKLLSVGFDDKKGLKKGGTVDVRDASSGQPRRKKRKVLDLDNDFAAITHDEGEKGIDNTIDNGDVNDNVNLHEEVVEKHAVTATELVEEGIKEGQKENDVAPPLEENIEFMKTVQL